MSSNSILSQPTQQNQESPDPANAAAWLQAKIELYEAKAKQLEAELKHTQILLKGHQIWLAEIEKAGQQ